MSKFHVSFRASALRVLLSACASCLSVPGYAELDAPSDIFSITTLDINCSRVFAQKNMESTPPRVSAVERKAPVESLPAADDKSEITQPTVDFRAAMESEQLNLPDTQSAVRAIGDFSAQISSANLERKYLVPSLERMLVSGGNFMLLGPPGGTKTRMIKQIIEHITVDGVPSSFYLQMHPEVTFSEMFGQIDFALQQRTGEIHRQIHDGAASAAFVFFDETPDAGPAALRSTLTFMEDGTVVQGRRVYRGIRQNQAGASNRTLAEMYERDRNNDLQAWLNRHHLLALVPSKLIKTQSLLALDRARNSVISDIELRNFLSIRQLAESVTLPDHVRLFTGQLATELSSIFEEQENENEKKVHELRFSGELTLPFERSYRQWNTRSLVMFYNELRALVALDYARGGRKELIASVQDVVDLAPQFHIVAPDYEQLSLLISMSHLSREKAMFAQALSQRETVKSIAEERMRLFNEAFERLKATLTFPLTNSEVSPIEGKEKTTLSDHLSKLQDFGQIRSIEDFSAENFATVTDTSYAIFQFETNMFPVTEEATYIHNNGGTIETRTKTVTKALPQTRSC